MDSHSNDSIPGSASSTGAAPIMQAESGTDRVLDDARDDEDEEYDGGLYYDDPDDYEDEEEEDSGDDEADDTEALAAPSSPAPGATHATGPAQHVVQQGESLISLGHRHKIAPQQILDHPENRHLRDQNRETSILNPGDIVTLPERSTKTVSRSSDQRHRFVYRGRFTTLHMKFHGMEGPLANEPYVLEVEDRQYQGQLDGEGGIEKRIPADAHNAIIRIGPNGENVVDIGVGHLNPISEVSGIQMRLNNLGYPCGNEDGELGPHSRAAIRQFQADHDLDETGQIDDQTRAQLRQAFGC